jgi:ClpP class serine protease
VAASGGFYLAAPAAEIIARPATLTGSIGVFGGKLVVGEGLRRLGIHTQEITDAPNANLYSATRPFSDDQRVRFRQSLQRFYDGFVGRVAAGRRMPVEEVEPHCRGRVWSGQAAFKNGLVDRHGDLLDAIDRARVLAGLEAGQYRRRELSAQPHRSVLTRAIQGMLRQILPGGVHARLGRFLEAVEMMIGGPLPPAFELLLTHPDQPLAMIDFGLEARR